MQRSRRIQGLAVVRRAGSPHLYLRGTIKGRRVFESLGTDDPELAEEARAARETELYRGAVFGEKPRVTFAAAAVSYLEKEERPASTKAFLNRILVHFGSSVTCQEIDQVAIDRACRALCRADAKPTTKLRNVITPARAVLMHAARRGWCTPPAFEATPAGPARTDWLAPAEAEALIGAAVKRQRHMRPLLTFLFCSGARLNEALELTWGDLDLQNARATLRGERNGERGTKNGGDRLVDLPVRAVAELANLPHRTGAVFRKANGKPYRSTRASRTVPYGGQVRRAFASCLEAAGIGRQVTPHHLRHTWAAWHYAVHKDLLLLKNDGGWYSTSQAERYAKLVPGGLVPLVLRFWNGGADMVHQGKHKKKVA